MGNKNWWFKINAGYKKEDSLVLGVRQDLPKKVMFELRCDYQEKTRRNIPEAHSPSLSTPSPL